MCVCVLAASLKECLLCFEIHAVLEADAPQMVQKQCV